MQLGATQILGLATAKLMVDYCSESLHILRLIQRNLKRDLILIMTDSTVCELIPLDLKLSEGFMQVTNHVLRLLWLSGELDIVHMLGEHGYLS